MIIIGENSGEEPEMPHPDRTAVPGTRKGRRLFKEVMDRDLACPGLGAVLIMKIKQQHAY